MTWDYRNPGIPQRGDGRYDNKFPDTYQVLDCLREHYYDCFKSDLSFNGTSDPNYYGCPETAIYAYQHTCKRFSTVRDKKPVFTFSIEKGKLNDKDNYVEFKLNSDIFKIEHPELVLQFLKKSIYDITNRELNLVLYGDNQLHFIHVPFDRKMHCLGQFADNHSIHYTHQEFINFISLLYDNQYFYINMISDDILSQLNENELDWINYMKSLGDNIYAPYYEEESKIEVGPKLEYVRFKK